MRDVTTGLLQPFGWGLGYPDWIDPASPAAGANFVHTVGGSHYERLIAATATVTTDANAANRFVSLDYMNAPLFVRPTGTHHPRPVFPTTDPTANLLLRTWAMQ